MVLEQVALLGIAGLDACLFNAYLNSRQQAAGRTTSSYQSTSRSVETTSSTTVAPTGDSVLLSDRLAAIKTAVGETKFADEVLPYELGALPSSSLADAARLEESPEEAGADSGMIIEAASPLDEKVDSLSDSIKSHDNRMQDLSSEFAVLEYRIAAVERMLGVEKAAQPQKSEQIDIPLKPVFVQPVVVERKAAPARRRKKRKVKKVTRKASRKKARKAVVKKVVRKKIVYRKAPVKKNARKALRSHARKRRKAVRTTNRVELVVKNARAAPARKRRKAARKTNRVELVLKNPVARKQKKRRRKATRASNRVELVVKNAARPARKKAAAKKKRKARRASNRVELVVKNARAAPARKRRKAVKRTNRVELVVRDARQKKAAPRKRKKAKPATNKIELVVKNAKPVARKAAAKKARKAPKAANRVELVLKEPQKAVAPAAEPKAQAGTKKEAASGSKDHMDIEWKGSKIKLYSGETKD